MKSSIKNTIEKLKSLFILNKEPVIAIYDEKIVICNNAAARFFGSDLEGEQASRFVPDHILTETAESFICSGVFSGKPSTASAVYFEDLLVLTLNSAEADHKPAMLVPDSLVSSLRSSAATMKISADQILKRVETSADDKLRVYASMLYHSYFTMLRLTVNLETVNGISNDTMPFSPKTWDLVTLCSDLVGSISHMLKDNGTNISFQCTENEVLANVDHKRMEQLILNLLTNSLLHTGPEDKIVLSLKTSDNRIIISVDDTGSGIPPKILSTIFSRYDNNITLSELAEGSGLGLNIAKGIAEKHGGALMIESRENKGTTVRVMFPANLEGHTSLRSPSMPVNSMNDILRELAVVIGYEYYLEKYMD